MTPLLRPDDNPNRAELELRYDGPIPRQHLEQPYDRKDALMEMHRKMAAHFRLYGAVDAAEWHENELRGMV